MYGTTSSRSYCVSAEWTRYAPVSFEEIQEATGATEI